MWAILLKYIEPVLSWLCIIAVVVWLVYAGAVKPVMNPIPTTTQTGGISNNYTIKVSPFSCARIPSPNEQMATAVKPVTDKVATTVKGAVK